MDVSNTIATSVNAAVNSPQQPSPKNDKQPEKQQEKQPDSTVVKLSEKAQQMNRAENQNNNTERAETRPQEAAEPPGIQLIEGEKKGGRVNTLA